MKRIRAAIAAAALFCGVLIGARGDALAGHPFGTEDAGTQGKGNVEAEFNLERQHGNDGTKTTSFGNNFTMGIAPKIDLAIGYAYDVTKADDGTKSRGMGPVEATLKTAVIEGKDRFPTLGVKAGFSLPTAEGEQAALLATVIAQWRSSRQRSSPTWGPTSERSWRGMPKEQPRSGQASQATMRSGRNGTSFPNCSGRNRPPLPPRPPAKD